MECVHAVSALLVTENVMLCKIGMLRSLRHIFSREA